MAPTDAHSETLVQRGRCRTHGSVQATKQVPKIRFPFLVYGALRLLAQRRPFRCPTCGAKVSKS